jgi:hypothetical protein
MLVFWDLTRPRKTQGRQLVSRHKIEEEHENDMVYDDEDKKTYNNEIDKV